MAHIVEFSIKGLAGRKDEIHVKLNRDINVFFGFNGSGKTSLLKILHSAMSNDASILKDVPFTEARVVIYSLDYKKNFEHKIKKVSKVSASKKLSKSLRVTLEKNKHKLVDIAPEHYASYFDFVEAEMRWEISPEKVTKGGWAHTYLPISRLYVGSVRAGREAAQKISEDQLDARFAEILQQVWMKYSYDVNSSVREAQEEGLASILRELLSPSGNIPKTSKEIPSDLALERVKQFLSRQKKKIPLNDESFLARYDSESWIRSIVGDIDRVEKNIEQAVFPIEKLNKLIHQLFGGKRVDFSGKEIQIELQDGTIISPQLLSSGEKQLLKLLIEVVAVFKSSIIIDEPELSMHIDWQKTLLQDMKLLNPDAQLIIATHSPEIMSEVEDSKIFRI